MVACYCHLLHYNNTTEKNDGALPLFSSMQHHHKRRRRQCTIVLFFSNIEKKATTRNCCCCNNAISCCRLLRCNTTEKTKHTRKQHKKNQEKGMNLPSNSGFTLSLLVPAYALSFLPFCFKRWLPVLPSCFWLLVLPSLFCPLASSFFEL